MNNADTRHDPTSGPRHRVLPLGLATTELRAIRRDYGDNRSRVRPTCDRPSRLISLGVPKSLFQIMGSFYLTIIGYELRYDVDRFSFWNIK